MKVQIMSKDSVPQQSLATFDHRSVMREFTPIDSVEPWTTTPERLRQVISCIDLTTLSGNDTEQRVWDLCLRAKEHRTAAVCVYPVFVLLARRALYGSGIPVATVSAAFPHGLAPLTSRVSEVGACKDLKADEIDIVIRRDHAIQGEWIPVYQEVRMFKQAAGEKHLKAILETGELPDADAIYRAALCACYAGADFVKTSTGKATVNATLEATAAMLAAVRDFKAETGRTVGLKPAGGIKTADQALAFMAQAASVMGDDYVSPATFRLGASSLLDDVLGKLG